MKNTQVLEQRWLHSHEEDSPDEMVYRPVSYPFPRSRGRSGFALNPDQVLEDIRPGSNDAPVSATGTWEVDEHNNLILHNGTQTQSRSIVSAEADCLILSKQTGTYP